MSQLSIIHNELSHSDLEDGHISPRVAAPVLSMLLMTYHAALGSDQKQDILVCERSFPLQQ